MTRARSSQFLFVLLLFLLAVTLKASTPMPGPATAATLSVSYTGTNYYTPVEDFSRCARWTWLTNCYTDPAASETAQQGVSSDAAFIVHNGQGTFQRVWVSLDELMSWDPTTGYQGFNSQYLANLDDALARFHA